MSSTCSSRTGRSKSRSTSTSRALVLGVLPGDLGRCRGHPRSADGCPAGAVLGGGRRRRGPGARRRRSCGGDRAGLSNWQFTEVLSGLAEGDVIVAARDSAEIKPEVVRRRDDVARDSQRDIDVHRTAFVGGGDRPSTKIGLGFAPPFRRVVMVETGVPFETQLRLRLSTTDSVRDDRAQGSLADVPGGGLRGSRAARGGSDDRSRRLSRRDRAVRLGQVDPAQHPRLSRPADLRRLCF